MLTEKLSIRDLQKRDILLLDSYWQSLTLEDLKRMSIDPQKLPESSEFRERLTKLLDTPPSNRMADPLIWEVDGSAVGFTNLNNIQRPEQGEIHLHMFNKSSRGKGYGRQLFSMSVREYFNRHGLAKIICQPSAANPGPNRLIAAIGISIQKTYNTAPSMICYEHEVNRYEITKADMQKLFCQVKTAKAIPPDKEHKSHRG